MSKDVRAELSPDTQIQQLRELCDQADKLRIVAEELCKELAAHIHQSYADRKADRRRGDRRKSRSG
jgi:hypothetical protein